MNMQRSKLQRTTNETTISGELVIGGNDTSTITTPVGFLTHMLEQFAFHSGCTLKLTLEGDTWRDTHHSIEDAAIVLGSLVREALGERKNIERYGQSVLPMDDVLCLAAVDLAQRPFFSTDYAPVRETVNDFPTEMFWHFWNSFCTEARLTLHINFLTPGRNEHHRIEAAFKAVARALRGAWQPTASSKSSNSIASTKGTL